MVIISKTCSECGNKSNLINGLSYISYNDTDLCSSCAQKLIDKIDKEIIITGSDNIEGYKITEYICVEASEIIIGTGMFMEFVGDISDIFEGRSSIFEKNMKAARQTVTKKLKRIAYEKLGNAIIHFDLDYSEISANRMGIIANGTIVKIEKI